MPALPAACLFDLDGLLLDTEPLHSRGWSEAASHFGAQLSNDQLLQLKGRRRLDCAALVSSWLPCPVESDALLAVQQPIVRALLPHAKAMPCAQQLVEHCDSQGIPMALVTSSSLEAVTFKALPHPWLSGSNSGSTEMIQTSKPASQTLHHFFWPRHAWRIQDLLGPGGFAGTAAAYRPIATSGC